MTLLNSELPMFANMQPSNKIQYFEYFLHSVYNLVGKTEQNDLSRLKLLKLLFFTTAARTKPGGDNILLNVFGNIHAMPYGHVESDIYIALRDKPESLKFYEVDADGTKCKSNQSLMIDSSIQGELRQDIKDEIDLSIKVLLQYNTNILRETAYNLVELSHQWYSWKKNYAEAMAKKKYSTPIPKEDIIEETKFFTLMN